MCFSKFRLWSRRGCMGYSHTTHLPSPFTHAGAVVQSDEPVTVRPFRRHVSRAPADLYEGWKGHFEIRSPEVVCETTGGNGAVRN